MIRLPASLERRLQELFPRVREREKFVVDTLTQALAGQAEPDNDHPVSIGGTLHLFTDGGSRGNPGQAAIACVLIDPTRGETVATHCERIGIETNNVAEYRALIEGLRLAAHYHPNKLVCHLDSELVVKQVRGEYAVRMPTLQPLVDEIRELAAPLPAVEFKHVPRADNHQADALVNKALDEHPAPAYERPH